MTLKGFIKDGTVVLDDHVELPDGTLVSVEVIGIHLEQERTTSKPKRVGGIYRGQIHIAPDFDELPADIAGPMDSTARLVSSRGKLNSGSGSSMAGLRYRSHGRSRQTGSSIRNSAEGRSCWLKFLRQILAFFIPNRFYPGTA